MPEFKYKALSEQGQRTSGVIVAQNEQELESRLSNMGATLISFKESSPRSVRVRKKRLSQRDIIHFTYQFEQLVSSGVPIVESLQDLSESSDTQAMKQVTSQIYQHVMAGHTLAEAFAKQQSVFGRVYVQMVRVGETSGQLSYVLTELHNNLLWQEDLMAKAKAMMRYPLIVLVAVLSAAIFLMVYLVPQLVDFLQQNNAPLPIYTRALIAVSDCVQLFWWFIVMCVIAFAGLIWLMLKASKKFRFWVDALKIKAPLIGEMNLKFKMARFTKHFGLMYGAGISVLDALKYCEPIVNNTVLESGIRRATKRIEEGEAISLSFSKMSVFPSLVVRMIKVGEASGRLDESMSKVAQFYEREVEHTIKRIEPIIMPVIILFLALLLMWIMAATLLPLYDTLGDWV